MNDDLHNIDDFFKKALDEHRETPSGNVWENIDKSLDKKRVIFISRKYNKLKWVAAALIIFSTSMAMYTLRTKMLNKELAKNIQNNRKENKGEPKEPIDKNKEDDAKQDENPLIQKDSALVTKQSVPQIDSTSKSLIEDHGKNLAEDIATNTTILKKEPGRDQIQKIEKDNSILKNDLHREELLVEKEKNLIIGETKNNTTNNRALVEEMLPKVVSANPEVNKKRFDIQQMDFGLQRALKTRQAAGGLINKGTASFSAKSSKIKSVSKEHFSVTAFYSPEFVSTKVDNDQHSFREDDRHEIKKNEKIKSAFTTGILVGYRTGKRITIESGLTFTSITTSIRPKPIFARPDNSGNVNFRFNCSAGYSYITTKTGSTPASGESIQALSSTNLLRYISLPLAVKYTITKGKFNFNPGLGVAVNLLTKGKIETAIAGVNGPEKSDINHIEGLRKSYVNGSVGVGINYNLSRALALNFTPSTKFALTSITKDAPFKTYLNSMGLAAGLSIKL